MNISKILNCLQKINMVFDLVTQQNMPINIFLDLSKAFDSINHKILLDKLKYYGLEGHTLKLFNSYLTKRKQHIELGDIKSKTLNIGLFLGRYCL